MEKLTVTREQQDTIRQAKNNGYRLIEVLNTHKRESPSCLGKIIAKMTEKQIASAWLGVADIEPEPVEPWMALKAIYEGKTVKKVDYDGGITILNDYVELDNFSVFHPDAVESLGTKFYILEDE